jgi:hypothetical protein
VEQPSPLQHRSGGEINLYPCFRGGLAKTDDLLSRDDCTRWFKYDRDYLCVNKSQFVPVTFEPPCIFRDIRHNCVRSETGNWYYVHITLQIFDSFYCKCHSFRM